jgi:hypothetical protein
MREEEPFLLEMKNLKFGIWHALDTKDWEEAEHLLRKARKLLEAGKATEKDRADLAVMEGNLQAFRGKEKGEKQPMEDTQKTLEEMRAAYKQVPETLQPLYLMAMKDGYDCAARLFQIIYNRKWIREHAGYSDHREKMLEEQATEETQVRAKGYHQKRGLENIKLGTVTNPEHSPAVRHYDHGEWAPTIIHMPHNTHEQMFNILRERKNSYAFGYWTTLIPTNVNYEKQVHLVEHVNWVLKRGMRKLQECGVSFTLSDTVIPAPRKGAPKSAQQASYATAI